MIPVTNWENCYDDQWKGLLYENKESGESAFSHPAKFSRGLIFRIVEYALQNGFIQPGQTIVDPFGGVGLGGWAAATCGLSWIGVELEGKFSTLSRHNFIEWAERYWCTCDENGNDYLRSMRESVSKVGVGSQPPPATQDGAILQPGLPQQISFFGQEIDTDSGRGDEGAQALEQGQALESRDAPEIVREGDRGKQGKREEWELEGGEINSDRWIYRDSSEWGKENGTPALDGIKHRPEARGIRVSASQEWGQTGQPFGKSRIDDEINAHEGTSSKWDKTESERDSMHSLREGVSDQQRDESLRAAMQAAKESRVLATARRQTEGKTCKTCGKLIVPFPMILQGDSRKLAEVIAGAGCVVGSPPYVGGGHHNDQTGAWGGAVGTGQPTGKDKSLAGYGGTPGQLGQLPAGELAALIASPPFAGNTGGRGEASRNGIDAALFDRHSGGMKKGTGDDPANLDHLPMGEVSAVIGSPPYATDALGHSRGEAQNGRDKNAPSTSYGSSSGQLGAMVVGSPPFAGSIGSDDPAKRGGILTSDPRRAGDTNLTGSYGESEGQLGAMVVGSPPYEGSGMDRNDKNGVRVGLNRQVVRKNRAENIAPGEVARSISYGDSDNQLGNETGETFWSAARLILDQCHQILPDNGYGIWVVKGYIKSGKLVDFPAQWQALCEACGFETVEIIRAWLVKRNGVQAGFDGAMVSKDVARKSFFRRLAEAKGSPPIDFETVLVTRKRGA